MLSKTVAFNLKLLYKQIALFRKEKKKKGKD